MNLSDVDWEMYKAIKKYIIDTQKPNHSAGNLHGLILTTMSLLHKANAYSKQLLAYITRMTTTIVFHRTITTPTCT